MVADAAVIEHLLNTARAFIFDTGLAPAAVGAAATALEVLRAEPYLAVRVRARAVRLAGRLRAGGARVTDPQGAVVSVLIGDPGAALAAADRLRESGVRVGCFRPPSVPDGISRLRLTARADLTDDEVERAATAVLHELPSR